MKIVHFEYAVQQLLKWYCEERIEDENDFNVLKTLKLIFFLTSIETSRESNDTLLDKVFNKFYAFPYGHLELDIYNHLKETKGELEHLTISNTKTTIKKLVDKNKVDYSENIENAIDLLKERNKNIVHLVGFDLVDLSQKHYSWAKNYQLARRNDKFKVPIELSEIKDELKIFNIY